MATMIGVDLGAHSVKLAVLTGRPGRFDSQEYLERAVPQSEDQHPDLERRLATAAAMLEELGPPPDTIWCVAYPDDAASARVVTLPFTDRAKINDTLPFELEGYVPFDLDDFVLDYKVLSAQDGRSTLLAVLAEKERLRRQLEGLAEMGVEPKHVMLDAEILATLVEGEGARLIMDLGHTRTLLCALVNGEMVAARALSFGGRRLIEDLVLRFQIDWREAEALLKGASLGGEQMLIEWEDEDDTQIRSAGAPSPEQVRATLLRSLSSLRAGMRSTLLALDEQLDLDLQEVLICGGLAHLDGLGSWLADDLGAPARRVWISEPAEDRPAPGRFALAQSLAMRAAGATNGRELDFRKGEFAFRGDLAQIKALIGAGVVTLTVFVAAALVLFAVRYVQLNQELTLQQDEIIAKVRASFPEVSEDRLRAPGMPKAIMVEKTAEAIARVEVLGATVGNEPPTLAMMKELTVSLPPPDEVRISVDNLTITPDAVNFKARTTSYEAAATVEESLKRSSRLSATQKSDETKRRDEIEFKITIPLGDDEEEEG